MAALRHSLRGAAWGRSPSGLERTDGSKCWQTPDDMLLPVFAYLAARDFNARDGKYIPAFAREGGGPGARTPEQRSPHRPQSTPDSQPHTAQDSQGPSRRTWRVAAGGVGSAP